MTYKSQLLKTLTERGYIYQYTPLEALDEICCKGPITAYVGFDATATSLHVGNLLMLMIARWIQETGNNPILLVGGGTTKLGDPSWRSAERPLLSEEKITENISGISKAFKKLLAFDGPHAARVVNNADWLDEMKYIPFLRDIGSHFSVNRMLNFEHVKSRLEQEYPFSFIEFNYILLQSYDFLELYKKYGCCLEFGGSDQWGNIISGVELVRRITGKSVYGITSSLITTSSGIKMGKTAQGAVWLNEDQVSPYEYWQFWRNTEDQDVIRFLKLYTLMPMKEIEKLSQLEGQELNQAKIILADHATALLHGETVLEGIHQTVNTVFKNQESQNLDSLPFCEISEQALVSGILILEILKKLQFIASRRAGRQAIRDRSVMLNDKIVTEELYKISPQDLFSQGTAKIALGKKKYGMIKIK